MCRSIPPWDFWYCYDMDRLGEVLEMLPHARFIGHGPGFWRHVSGDEADCRNAYPTGNVTPGGKIVTFLKRYPNLYCDPLGRVGSQRHLTRSRMGQAVPGQVQRPHPVWNGLL